MALGLSVSVTNSTSVVVTFTGQSGSGYVVDLQIGLRPDFQFCLAPVYALGNAPSQTVRGLNQGTQYYARARERKVSDQTVSAAWTDPIGFYTPVSTAQVTTPAAVMIKPALIVRPEPVLEWAMDGNVAGFSVANLGRDAPNTAKAASAQTPPYFEIAARLDSAIIDTIAVLGTNVPEDATVQIYGGPSLTNVQSGSPAYTAFAMPVPFRASLNVPGRVGGWHGLFRLSSPQSYAWWRVVITPGSTVRTFVATYAIFGLNRATKNHSIDKKETPLPLTTIERKRSGTPDRVLGLPMRRVAFDISYMTEAQYETILRPVVRYQNEPMLIIPNMNPGAFLHDRILFGDLSGGDVTNPSSPRYTRSFTIDSLVI